MHQLRALHCLWQCFIQGLYPTCQHPSPPFHHRHCLKVNAVTAFSPCFRIIRLNLHHTHGGVRPSYQQSTEKATSPERCVTGSWPCRCRSVLLDGSSSEADVHCLRLSRACLGPPDGPLCLLCTGTGATLEAAGRASLSPRTCPTAFGEARARCVSH